MDSRHLLCGHCGPRTASLSCRRCGIYLCAECRINGCCPACVRALQQRRRRRWRRAAQVLVLGVAAGLTVITVATLGYRRTCCHCGPRAALQQLTVVRQALDHYMLEEGRCPADLSALSSPRWLRPGSLIDRWGSSLIYRCSGDNVLLASAGPDRLHDTEDDIRLVTLLNR